MRRSVELMKFEDGRSLVLLEINEDQEFVVCSNYDKTKEVGNQWDWGHYFYDLEEAIKYGKRKRR